MLLISVLSYSHLRIVARRLPTGTFLTHRIKKYIASSTGNDSIQSVSKKPLDMVAVKTILRTAQAVCFDVDSTVIPEEGIDQLAEFQGAGAAVAEWTKKAMGGQVLFQDALAARLDLIKPSRADMDLYLQRNPPKLTKGIKNLIDVLHRRGTIVYLVSGGFRQMIEPVADLLNIPRHRIYANTILYKHSNITADDTSGSSNDSSCAISSDGDGEYAGFDIREPTSRDGGKSAVMEHLIHSHGYHPVVMVGDGATDMQAKPPADLFIGFGGVVVRESVQKGADWFVKDFQDVINILTSEDL